MQKSNKWIEALRLYSFPASTIPVLVGSVLAFSYASEAVWIFLPFIALCGFLFHMGANVLNDYFDFIYRVDTSSNAGASNVLVRQLFHPKQLFIFANSLLAAGFMLSCTFIAFRGMPVFFLGLFAVLGAYAYTAKPFSLKSRSLGEPAIFLLMGPCMVSGTYYVLTGFVTIRVILVSIPIGFMVAAILNANNLRDYASDKIGRMRTLANIVPYKAARWEYPILIMGAYACIIILIARTYLPRTALLVLLTAPYAIQYIIILLKTPEEHNSGLTAIVIQTARLHCMVGMLLAVSLLIARIR